MIINNKVWRSLSNWKRYELLLNAYKKTMKKWEEKQL